MIIRRPILNVSAIAGIITLLLLDVSHAATYSVVANVSHVYSLAPAEILPTPNIHHRASKPRIYQVDLYVNASGFNSGADQRGFANITFDLSMTSGLDDATMPGWRANTATVDSHSASGIVPLWHYNQDTVDANLQNILASIAVIPSPNAADPRPNVGQYPTFDPLNLLGSVYLNWSGASTETLTIIAKQPSFAHASNGMYEVDPTPILFTGSISFGDASLPIGDINGDYIVNQLDMNVVFGNWLSTNAVLSSGDANGDGVVNQLDINTITGNWLTGSGPVVGLSATLVPEPTSWMLLAVATVVATRRFRVATNRSKA